MTQASNTNANADMVTATIDDIPISVPKGTSIYDAAAKIGVKIPVLCHREHMRPVGVCRVCSVDVGQRVMAAACCREVDPGMKIQTHHTSAKAAGAVRTLLELLVTDHLTQRENEQEYGENELETLARTFDAPLGRMPERVIARGRDLSSLVIAVNHEACILCDRCVRACNEVRENHVLARVGKGYETRIGFDLDVPMGESSCVACGECMVSCPTGALANKSVMQQPIPDDDAASNRSEVVTASELERHPLFQGISRAFLSWNSGAVVRRRLRKGEILCREGEFGNTAFYLEQGSVDIFIQSKLGHVKSRKSGKAKGWFPRLTFRSEVVDSRADAVAKAELSGGSGGSGGSGAPKTDGSSIRYIQIDAPVALEYDNPIATLSAGSIFGEQACMNNQPRSATIRAAEDCVLFEMLRNVLYIMRRGKASRAMLDEIYRSRMIESFFRTVPIFSDLLQNETQYALFVTFIQSRVELIRLEPGHVVFRQGDPADDFYMVLLGFVKVSQHTSAGERVLNYLGKGGFFGEIGLMSAVEEIGSMVPLGVRTATCSSLDHVDLLRVKGKDFQAILRNFPLVRNQLARVAKERLQDNLQHYLNLETRPLGAFLDQGLMEAQSLLVLDLERCTRCDECTKACADSHDGVTRLIREGLRFDRFLVASSCRSCLDPYCLPGCPVDAIHRNGKTLEITIEDHCIGCGKCSESCPYGNINMHEFLEKIPDPDQPRKKMARMVKKATTCDLCVGYDGQPSCVYACPHDAAHRMTGPQLLDIVAKTRSV